MDNGTIQIVSVELEDGHRFIIGAKRTREEAQGLIDTAKERAYRFDEFLISSFDLDADNESLLARYEDNIKHWAWNNVPDW